MNFSFTDEQNLLRESVEKLVAAEYPFEVRRELAASEAGFSHELWRKFAELGWLGLGIPEDAGGVGEGPVETAIVMEGLGAGLAVEPYLATVVMGADLLKRGGVSQRDRLTRLAGGELQLAFAFAERQSRYELSNVETRAEPDGDGYRITGSKSVVFNAPAGERHRGERADFGQPPGTARDSPCSPSTRTPPASPCGSTARWTACARARSTSRECGPNRAMCSAGPTKASRSSKGR